MVTNQLDDSAELSRLGGLLEKLGAVVVELQHSNSQMEARMKDLEAPQLELTAMKTEVANLKAENSALKMEMKTFFRASAAQQAELTLLKSRFDPVSQAELENPKKDIIGEKSKVTFSAGLPYGFTYSGNRELDVVFSEIITNVGQAYSSVTGLFTAPVKGVYYF